MVELESTFLAQVDRVSGQQVESCYHCHTCTAGCPVSADMQYGPDRILRMIELGFRQRVLSASDIWLCAGCETCAARCPNEIEVARVMDTLRQLSLAEGLSPALPRIPLFHRVYLQVIKTLGRSHEASMLVLYKLLSRDLFSDLDSGLALILRGKIPLIPKPTKQAAAVQRLFEAAAEADRDMLGLDVSSHGSN
jgi:heterodisulfide reductase subunit C